MVFALLHVAELEFPAEQHRELGVIDRTHAHGCRSMIQACTLAKILRAIPPENLDLSGAGDGAAMLLLPGRGADAIVDEGQLVDDRRRQHERIEVRQAHAAIDQLAATVNDTQASMMGSIGGLMRIEIELGGELAAVGDAGAQAEAESLGRFQRVDHVEVVGPGLGESPPRGGQDA